MNDEFDFEMEFAREWLGIDSEPLGVWFYVRTIAKMTAVSGAVLAVFFLASI